MKNTVLLLLSCAILVLTSCETTKEITLDKEGKGLFVTTSDMSGLIGMAKMAGGGGNNELSKLEQAMDTTISLSDKVDSLPDLKPEEKELLRGGSLGIVMDMKNDKMITKLSFPFSQPGQIQQLEALSAKIVGDLMKSQMHGENSGAPPGLEKAMPQKSVEEYFSVSYSKGVIEKKLNTEKYAGLDKDEDMQALKQMSGMGLGTTKIIINLPSTVKKTEGKNLTVSEDKKVVTIMSNTEDFFEDGKNLEFRIEY